MELNYKLLSLFKKVTNRLGINITRYYPEGYLCPDIEEDYQKIINSVKPFTMTSPERIFALCKAVEYIVSNQIPGNIVECGVWKGGSMMAVAQTLLQLQDLSKHLYLFDTFEGMTEPSGNDLDFRGVAASEQLKNSTKESGDSIWCYSCLEEVKASVHSVGYNRDRIHFIKGKVEDTIPQNAPAQISLLRLDTDWYESTHHELIHLFPRIAAGGVIIIDDYGYWQGARKAVDEYIQEHKIPILLNRIDFTGRIGIVTKSMFPEPLID